MPMSQGYLSLFLSVPFRQLASVLCLLFIDDFDSKSTLGFILSTTETIYPCKLVPKGCSEETPEDNTSDSIHQLFRNKDTHSDAILDKWIITA